MKRKNILRYNLRLFSSLLAQALIFFFAAGQLGIWRAWLFFTLTIIYYFLSFIIIYRFNPELIYYRGGPAFRNDSKLWDKHILLAYAFLGVYGQFLVAGWDLGHIKLFYLGYEYLIIGLILFTVSNVLILWSMVRNPFFEPTVRIQKERDQKVISAGPYRIIRHPGYLSGILWHLAMPLIMGSSLALIYSIIIFSILILRTHLEDKILQKELQGYIEYAEKTRYRLLPGVW